MKFVRLITIAALLCSAVVSAEDNSFAGEKGNRWFGGSLSFSSMGFSYEGESSEIRLNSVGVSPTLRFFPSKGLFMGPKIEYNRLSLSYEGERDGLNILGAGGEVGFLYGDTKAKPYFLTAPQFSLYFEEGYAEPSFTLPFGAGVMIPFANNIGIQLETGLQLNFDDELTTNIFYVGFGFTGMSRNSAVSAMTIVKPGNGFLEMLWW